jgi:hypothetical protein
MSHSRRSCVTSGLKVVSGSYDVSISIDTDHRIQYAIANRIEIIGHLS